MLLLVMASPGGSSFLYFRRKPNAGRVGPYTNSLGYTCLTSLQHRKKLCNSTFFLHYLEIPLAHKQSIMVACPRKDDHEHAPPTPRNAPVRLHPVSLYGHSQDLSLWCGCKLLLGKTLQQPCQLFLGLHVWDWPDWDRLCLSINRFLISKGVYTCAPGGGGRRVF